MFFKFIKDEDALDMFITGSAGTGKTTGLAKDVQYCIDNEIPYVVVAYTHKACDVLRSKLPEGARIQTIHSFIKKRPGINTNATQVQHVATNILHGKADEEPIVMFLDEYSMVGEADFDDIGDIQEGRGLKVVWIGDSNQLPPVGDRPAVTPYGEYQVKLTKVHRQAADNPLLEPLTNLVSFIERRQKPFYLEPNDKFIRNCDLVELYRASKCRDKVLLAFTNQRVQSLNADIKGRPYPENGDGLFSPTNKEFYDFVDFISMPDHCVKWNGEVILPNSKYRTLETLQAIDGVQFADVTTDDGELITLACVFGHYDFKVKLEELQAKAVEANNEVEKQSEGLSAAQWCKQNYSKPLARKRAKAWRELLSFKDCVQCIDFDYAMTVHKSQGSTYEEAFVDTSDIAVCQNLNTMLKLMYVAISRASNKVYTS